MKTVISFGLGLALTFALAGCGDDKKEAPKDGGKGNASNGGGEQLPVDNTAEVLPDAGTTGTITITVKLKGKAPERAPIDMSDADCAAAHAAEPAMDEAVVANADGTLQNAMVWVEGIDAKYVFKAPAKAITVDQNGCMYKPHVLTMMTKQAIEVKNSDGVRHNIHATPKQNGEFNFSQESKNVTTLTTASKDKTFVLAEVPVHLKCEVHSWMGAWVGVFKHPFHGVTGTDGMVKLTGVPPGTYKVKVWQEKYGMKEVEVTLAAKGAESKTVEFGE